MPFIPEQTSSASSFKPDSSFKADPITPDSADKAANPNGPPSAYSVAKGGATSPPDIEYTPERMGSNLRTAGKLGISAGLMALAPEIEGPGILAGLGRSAVGGGGMGLQKYLGNLIDQKQDPYEGVVKDAAIGAVIPTGADLLSGGLKEAANSSMLRSVGLVGAKSKNIPSDLGNRMVDAGIWGTKAQMAEKVASKYAQSENEIQSLANDLKGSVSGDTLAQAVSEKAKRYLNPETGTPISGGEGAVGAIQKVSDYIKTGAKGYQKEIPSTTSVRNMVDESGDLTPISSTKTLGSPETQGSYGGQGLMKLKRQGDQEAFNQSGALGNSYQAEAYKAQADAARKGLSDLSEGAMPEALKNEQTLLYANKGLNQPSMVYKNPVSLTDIGSAMVGASSHGLPGAGTAVLASKAAVSPLVQSLFAKAAQRGSKIVDPLEDSRILQSLFGTENALDSK